MRWLAAFVVGLVLAVLPQESSVPTTIIYNQTWAAGNSLFTSMDVYDRDAEGADPLYPEIMNAEAVTISGGKLDWSGTYSDYQGAGIALNGFPTFVAERGYIEATYRPNATSLASTPYHVVVATRVLGSNSIAVFWDGSVNEFDIYVYGWGFGNTHTAQPAYTFVAGVDYTVRIEWQCGTHDVGFSTVAADGYVRIYVNDVLIDEVTNFAFFQDYTDANKLKEVWFGYFGLLGTLDDITFASITAAAATTAPDVIIPTSVPCCGDGGGGAATGPILPPISTDWTPACTGGGTVPTASDLTDSEDWSA